MVCLSTIHTNRSIKWTRLVKLTLMWDQRAGGNSDETEVDQVMKDCDKDGDGFIDELEFVSHSIQAVAIWPLCRGDPP